MKNGIKRILQSVLGFDRYLSLFARIKVHALRFDKKESDFFAFLKMVPDSGVVLDIGANLGMMSWHMLSYFKHAEVWAFEPIPDNLKVLKSLVAPKRKDRYKLFEIALGEENGHISMVLPKVEQVRMQGLSHVVHDSIEDFNEGDQYQVEMRRLDDLIDGSVKVTGIKIDVENFEYFVLKGGRNMIGRDHPLIYTELWDNENRYKCFDFLSELGYEIKVYQDGTLRDFEKGLFSGQNFFFVHEG